METPGLRLRSARSRHSCRQLEPGHVLLGIGARHREVLLRAGHINQSERKRHGDAPPSAVYRGTNVALTTLGATDFARHPILARVGTNNVRPNDQRDGSHDHAGLGPVQLPLPLHIPLNTISPKATRALCKYWI